MKNPTHRGRQLEFWATVGLCSAFSLYIPQLSVLRYGFVLAFLFLILTHYSRILYYATRIWPIFLLPGLMCLSFVWSPSPSSAIRHGLFFALAFLTWIFVAYRLSFAQILISFFVPLTVLALLSFLSPNMKEVYGGAEQAAVGVFSGKNVLGKRMVTAALLAVGIISLPRVNLITKIWAAAALFIAASLVFLSASSQAIIHFIFGTGIIVGLGYGYRLIKKTDGLTTVISFFAVIGMSLLLFLFVVMEFNPYVSFLQAIGKNETLTGRTEIWEYGWKNLQERPWFGTGVEGFWVPTNREAYEISSIAKLPPEVYKFYFHNAYLEFGVHLGLPGLILFCIMICYFYYRIAWRWMRYNTQETTFFLAISSIILIRSFIESEMYVSFDSEVALFWIAFFRALIYPVPNDVPRRTRIQNHTPDVTKYSQ